jgi:hypothetical protein
MRRETEVKNDSSIFSKIEGSHLSEHETQLTVDAMHHADLFADGLLWTMHKIEDLSDQIFGKHDVRH